MDNLRRAAASTVDDARAERRRRFRRRFLLCTPQLSAIAVVGGLIFGGVQLLGGGNGSQSSSSPAGSVLSVTGVATVYSVSQVLTGLQQDPSSWLGHTITVQGVLEGPIRFCAQATPCPPERLALMDDGNAVLGSSQYLPIHSASTESLPYNKVATYSLQLKATPDACALNPAIVCYEGTALSTASSN
ncbi:MAG: hypothetical protein ACRDG4_02050 [Chloroflexota bacterium]